MQNFFRKIILLLLIIVTSITVIGCDSFNTTDLTTATNTTTSDNSTTDLTTATNTTTSDNSTTEANSTTNNSNNNIYVRLQILDIQKTEYNIGSSFDYDSIVVVLVKTSGPSIPLSNSVYTLSGFDSSVMGEQTITISYLEYTTNFTITIVNPSGDLIITMAYYLSAQDLMGSDLFDELHNIINTGFSGVTYGDVRYILDETDTDPANPNNLILVYLGTSISNNWDSGATWNREHVWPQSLLPEYASNELVNIASDLQNLKPANPGENSSRSNRYYDNESVAGLSYAPRDEVKGDIARILLYMITMYDQLSLVDTNPAQNQMAMLSVLLEWNKLDPVDDFERNRNDVIYSYQNNRNPYIDYPEFVDLIWGE